ncbi:MAG: hypothetical protein CMO36_09570 [Verrucomicrobiaceae bacterium]|nr:hypothetical protein [Verrucomicrobiaceae bacterium]
MCFSFQLIRGLCFLFLFTAITKAEDVLNSKISIEWKDDILSVFHPSIPGGKIDTWYLEAYCRPGSTDRVWDKTVIGHETKIVHSNKARNELKLRCHLKDGVIVDHHIKVENTGVRFDLIAHNPTKKTSQAHWAQPCIRVGEFTGHGKNITDDKYAYIKKCFVFQDKNNVPDFLPTKNWSLKARYTPGQVWRPKNINRNDVNPRPLNPIVPYKNIIGCISKDQKWLLASVWDPCQELFQGVIRCIHSDFRIGGLEPGEKKEIRGKMYIMKNDINAFLKIYDQEFPSNK